MPRSKKQKQKKETRREKQNKETKQNENVDVDPDDSSQDTAKEAFVEKYMRMGNKLVEPYTLLAEKYENIFDTASPDERLEAFHEEMDVVRQAVDTYQNIDSIGQVYYTETIEKILAYAEDMKLTLERIQTLKNKRVPFQQAIDHYEAITLPRPDFKVLSVSFNEGNNVPIVQCSEDIPKRELAYRIRQYQAYFYNQYFLHCAPLNREIMHRKLSELFTDTNTDTRVVTRQMQMPKL